jgi:transcriptional regulator with XRE-family HTH domain
LNTTITGRGTAAWSKTKTSRGPDAIDSRISIKIFIKCAVKKNIRTDRQKKLLVLLRGVRVEAGGLASRLGLDQTFISKYESEERRLDILELREVCRVIGIDFFAFIPRLDKDLSSSSWPEHIGSELQQLTHTPRDVFDFSVSVCEPVLIDPVVLGEQPDQASDIQYLWVEVR